MQSINRLEQQLSCSTCPWNRNCVSPPTMTEEEVNKEIGIDEKPDVSSKEAAEQSLFTGMFKAMVYAGKDKEAPVCPVFARALREGPEISQKIKEIMQGR